MSDLPLVHIGYHKTGTTWFQDLVFDNQDYGFASPLTSHQMMDLVVQPNELDYRPDETRVHFDQARKQVNAAGLTPVFSCERFSGHPHSGGYDSKLIALRLRALFDNARILIVLREQTAMILSCYNQYIRRGGAISLTAYISVKNRWRLPLFDFDHFAYHRLIQLYFDLFGRENVLVLPYELFVAEPQNFTTLILTHAGITDIDDKIARMDFKARVNTSLSPLEVQVNRRVNFMFGSRSPVNQTSPLPRLSRPLKPFYSAVQALGNVMPDSYDKQSKQAWNKTIRKFAGDRYQESNQITSALIGYDLGKMSYDI